MRTFFALDSRLATTALAVLTWLPAAAKATRGLPLPGTEDWIVTAQNRTGIRYWASGRNQSRTTALITATAVTHTRTLPPGVRTLHHMLELSDLPASDIRFGREVTDP
ncbi:hypothetical protein J2W56_006724 [Nocardia kruczakiae]|uniref:Uncharacterized protein n=1 Tax=Nocardia kruczakiae TaxID=261477 RepID=A0ABU1XQZ8_9NOCA|nr:hypothetical protein [Nocardia kruczakiae]MDR7172958.1 hypothetical protein [Nocardia kruczakiae]